MRSGILIIDKEQGKTSRDVVNEICHKLGTKKVGHTGTLDPLATGVLVVAVGEGTKIIQFLMSDEKEYIAEVVVGMQSDTLDVEGKVEDVGIKQYTRVEIEEVLKSFVGCYEQEVPKYSAVHVDGKRLYEYARQEEEVILPKRKVEIRGIELLTLGEGNSHQTFQFRVVVSKGTYIRSLIRDIGEKLGSSCIMKNLRRIRQGSFCIANARKVPDIEEDDFISLSQALEVFPKQIVRDKTLYHRIQNGAQLPNAVSSLTRMVDEDDTLLALYIPVGDVMKPVKVFQK